MKMSSGVTLQECLNMKNDICDLFPKIKKIFTSIIKKELNKDLKSFDHLITK